MDRSRASRAAFRASRSRASTWRRARSRSVALSFPFRSAAIARTFRVCSSMASRSFKIARATRASTAASFCDTRSPSTSSCLSMVFDSARSRSRASPWVFNRFSRCSTAFALASNSALAVSNRCSRCSRSSRARVTFPSSFCCASRRACCSAMRSFTSRPFVSAVFSAYLRRLIAFDLMSAASSSRFASEATCDSSSFARFAAYPYPVQLRLFSGESTGFRREVFLGPLHLLFPAIQCGHFLLQTLRGLARFDLPFLQCRFDGVQAILPLRQCGLSVFEPGGGLRQVGEFLLELPLPAGQPSLEFVQGRFLLRQGLRSRIERRLPSTGLVLRTAQFLSLPPQGGLVRRELFLLGLHDRKDPSRLFVFGPRIRLALLHLPIRGGLPPFPFLLGRGEGPLTLRQVGLHRREGLFSLRDGRLASCELATGTLDRLRFRGQLEACRVEIFSGSLRFLSGPIERGLSLSDLGMGLRQSGLSFLEVRLRQRQRFFASFHRHGPSVHFGQGGLVRFVGGSVRLLPFVDVARLAFAL